LRHQTQTGGITHRYFREKKEGIHRGVGATKTEISKCE